MMHKLNSIPTKTLNRVKDKQRQQQIEKHFLHSKQRLAHQINQYDDFLTMMLVNASFNKVVNVTKILIQLVNFHHRQENDPMHQLISYRESIFADYTPIPVIEEDECSFHSFRQYYNMVLDECISHLNAYTPNELASFNEKSRHLKTLLRSCFIIAFVYDVRIRRFVMARHKIHYEVIKTRPPNVEAVNRFIKECRVSFVDPFLSSQTDIVQMSQSCVQLWIDQYMLNLPLPTTYNALVVDKNHGR